MNVRQLQIFAEAAKQLSFSKAALSIHIAQPAISIAIKKLENELDTVLFNRNTKNISLTAEGVALLKHAERILAQVDEAKLEMLELKGLERGEVSIAMPAMHGAFYFPEVISGFMNAYPNVRIHAKEAEIAEIERDLLSGAVDLGLVIVGQASAELEVHPLVDEEMVACVPPRHPLLKHRSIRLEHLLHEPLILLMSGYFLREAIERASVQLRVKPNVVFDTNLIIMPLIRKLVLDGRGVAVCLALALENEKEMKGLPFDPPIRVRMGLAWRKGRYLSAANRAFVDHMLNGDPKPAKTRRR